MFGQAVAILHQGRWTLYAQHAGDGRHVLTLVGDAVPEIREQRDAAGRVTVAAAPALEEVVQQLERGQIEGLNAEHPFTRAEIERELGLLPIKPGGAGVSAEVTKAGVIQ